MQSSKILNLMPFRNEEICYWSHWFSNWKGCFFCLVRRLLLRHKRKTCARFLVIPFFLFLVVSAEVVNSVYSVELGYSSLIPIDHLYFGDCINRFPFGLRVALRTNQYPKWLKVIEANHRRPRPLMAQQRPKPTTKLPTKKTPLTHRIFKWAKAAIAEAINQSLL